jgi:hypothetical protein
LFIFIGLLLIKTGAQQYGLSPEGMLEHHPAGRQNQ